MANWGSPSNRTGRVECRGGLSSPWQALPEVGGRVPGRRPRIVPPTPPRVRGKPLSIERSPANRPWRSESG